MDASSLAIAVFAFGMGISNSALPQNEYDFGRFPFNLVCFGVAAIGVYFAFA